MKHNTFDLDRYVHFYTRYTNHEMSKYRRNVVECAITNLKHTLERRGKLVFEGSKYATDAARTLNLCYRTLMCSYVRAYFENDPLQIHSLQKQQGIVEINVERLAECLEKNLMEMSVEEVRRIAGFAECSRRGLAGLLPSQALTT